MPTRQAREIEWKNTKRRIEPSWPNQLVAVEATTIDCASIILPMTPPEELAAPIRIGDRPSCSEVIFCRLPNRMLDEVSEPVATISAITAAMCAFTLLDAISTSSVTTGNAAATVENTELLNGL